MIRQELALSSPLINASGMLGYAPPARWPVEGIDNKQLGAFVTNPISLHSRAPAAGRAQIDYLGGALLHSGLPNAGLKRALRKYGARWAQSSLPVWVHLLASQPDEVHQMVRMLEDQEGVMAVELSLPVDASLEERQSIVEAACGELPLIVQLPMHVITQTGAERLIMPGVSAVSLGAPRGMLLNNRGQTVSGRLYGPALLPQTMLALKSAKRFGVPVIAGPGVYRRQDAQTLLGLGAFAVQLDTVLWRGWVNDVTFPG